MRSFVTMSRYAPVTPPQELYMSDCRENRKRRGAGRWYENYILLHGFPLRVPDCLRAGPQQGFAVSIR
jgi:hypothetical protein